MADEKKAPYSNIRTLKQLQDDSYLPSLKKKMSETKRNIDDILKEFKEREKQLTKIKQEAKLAEKAEGIEKSAIEQPTQTPILEKVAEPVLHAEKPKQDVAPESKQESADIIASSPTTADKPQEKIVFQSRDNQRPPYQQRNQYGDRPQQPYKPGERPYQNQNQNRYQNNESRPQYPRTDGQQYPRTDGQQRYPRPDGQQYPRTDGQQRYPRTDGQTSPRPDGQQRYPRPDGQQYPRTDGQTSPRPDGQQRYQNTGPRPAYGERRPYNNDNRGPRPPYGTNQPRPPYGTNQPRPPYGSQQRPPFGAKPSLLPKADSVLPVEKNKKVFNNDKKKAVVKVNDDRKGLNKKALIKKGFVDAYIDEDRMGSRRYRSKKQKEFLPATVIKIEHAVVNADIVPIKVLSEKIGVTAVEITKKLFKEGIIKTINDCIDFTTAEYIAASIGVALELRVDKTAEENMLEKFIPENDNQECLESRPPIVTVMGHVDHGKTSLLDAIRKTNVTDNEAGGITQHIGAYTIKSNKRDITFIDTPGHEAFTAMRKRGADVTDIAILVVAADDGVMPQTIEAISHAKAADVPIIVAINKMDKPTANIDRIKQQLADHNVLCEDWGGDVIMVPVSAHTKSGIDNLLEMILLVADVKELKANTKRLAKGIIIEARLDKGRGPIASVIVQNGTLNVGDIVIAGIATGKIRAMIDDKGRNIKEAGPSVAVSVLGFSEVPQAGDEMHAVPDEKVAKTVAVERKDKQRVVSNMTINKVTLDDMFDKITEGQIKGLNIIIKADVQGSVEAVKQALLKLSNEEVKINVIHGGVGAVTESDVMLASTSSAIVIAFNVKPDAKAKQTAERDGVDIRNYKIIYDAINDITTAMKGMLEPKFREVVTGKLEVRQTIKVSSIGVIAGCFALEGKIVRNSGVRIYREGDMIHEGKLSSLKRFKDDVKEVASGYECGLTVDGFNDIKENDIVEAFISEEIK